MEENIASQSHVDCVNAPIFSVPDTAIHITKYKGRDVDVWYEPFKRELYVEKNARTMKKYIAHYKKMNPEDIHVYRIVKPSISFGTKNSNPVFTYVVRACDSKQVHMNQTVLDEIVSNKEK